MNKYKVKPKYSNKVTFVGICRNSLCFTAEGKPRTSFPLPRQPWSSQFFQVPLSEKAQIPLLSFQFFPSFLNSSFSISPPPEVNEDSVFTCWCLQVRVITLIRTLWSAATCLSCHIAARRYLKCDDISVILHLNLSKSISQPHPTTAPPPIPPTARESAGLIGTEASLLSSLELLDFNQNHRVIGVFD